MRKITLRAKTYHDGANEERSCILRKIKRMLIPAKDEIGINSLGQLQEWIEDRDKRYKKKAGGL